MQSRPQTGGGDSPRRDSPQRATKPTRTTVTRFSTHMMEQRENSDLHLDLKKTQAENEDHKNVLIGLGLKLTVHNDLKKDLAQNKRELESNEKARDELGNTLKATAGKVREDAQQHKMYADMLCNEIAGLKKASNDQEVRHQKEIKDIGEKLDATNQKHADKVQELEKANDALK